MANAVLGVLLCGPLLLLLALRFYITSCVRCKSKNRLDGKTIIITGANSGIGRATAVACAVRGAKVVLACRNKTKAEATMTMLRRTTGSENIHYLPLDLAAFNSIHEFVKLFRKEFNSCYALINNAGYLGPQGRTKDGYDRTFQVNYLGHFLLTNVLVRSLRPPPNNPIRVINVTSDSYRQVALDFDNLMHSTGAYIVYDVYGRSKLAMMLFTSELNRHCADLGVTAVAVHPGAVKTGLLNNWPGVWGKVLRLAAKLLFRSPEAGAETIVHCVAANDLEPYHGQLVWDCTGHEVEPHARDHIISGRLWTVSSELCNIEENALDQAQNGYRK